MQESFDFPSYSRQVRQLSRSLMTSGRNAAEISGRMHLLTVATERDLERFGDPAGSSRVACGPGCGVCCVLRVEVLFPEAVAIVRYLQKRLPETALAELREKLRDQLNATSWLTAEEYLFLRRPCAFLDDRGSCSIHIVRPLLCRAITSTDPQACNEAIAMAPLQGVPTVEMNLFQKELFETVFREFGAALEDLGLDHRPWRLDAAILTMLDDHGAVAAFVDRQQVRCH